MKIMKRFWADLNRALIDARRMSASDASSMIETRLDEYWEIWPQIEAACTGNLSYRGMIARAFALRYMLGPAMPLAPARKRSDR